MLYHYPEFRFNSAVTSFLIIVGALVMFVACKKETPASEGSPTGQHISVHVGGPAIKNGTMWMEILKVEAGADTVTIHNTAVINKTVSASNNIEPLLWKPLAMQPGIYNITALQESTDHLLASGSISGTIKALRYKIGVHNTIIKPGTIHPVGLTNSTDGYLYTMVRSEDLLKSDENETWIQIDMNQFINDENGSYGFKPWN